MIFLFHDNRFLKSKLSDFFSHLKKLKGIFGILKTQRKDEVEEAQMGQILAGFACGVKEFEIHPANDKQGFK